MPRPLHDVRVLARVPSPPGLPEGIAERDGRIYVATNPGGDVPNGPQVSTRSRIFVYDAETGTYESEIPIEGQDLDQLVNPAYGLQAMAFDGDGALYAIDKAPARILRIDVETGEQSDYARFPNVPLCATSPHEPCSEAAVDRAPFPNYLAFAPDGYLYVSDFQQALVWRVPAGGGEPEIAITDLAFSGGLGPNGLQFMADGETLVLVVSINPPGIGTTAAGRLYTMRRQPDGTLSKPEILWESQPEDGLDGIALAASGAIYVALFIANQIVLLSPEGEETARIGVRESGANGSEIPFDMPASMVFVGERLLVTNHSAKRRVPEHFAVFDIAVGEPGLPLFRPSGI